MYARALRLSKGKPWTGLGYRHSFMTCSSFGTMAVRTYDVSYTSWTPIRTTHAIKDAIDALNTLQTSFRVLEERRKAGIRLDENVNAEMRAWLKRIGYSVSPQP